MVNKTDKLLERLTKKEREKTPMTSIRNREYWRLCRRQKNKEGMLQIILHRNLELLVQPFPWVPGREEDWYLNQSPVTDTLINHAYVMEPRKSPKVVRVRRASRVGNAWRFRGQWHTGTDGLAALVLSTHLALCISSSWLSQSYILV